MFTKGHVKLRMHLWRHKFLPWFFFIVSWGFPGSFLGLLMDLVRNILNIELGSLKENPKSPKKLPKESITISVWYIFSKIKGPLKSNLLPNIKDFLIFFVGRCSILSFSKLYLPQEVGNLRPFWFFLKSKIEAYSCLKI